MQIKELTMPNLKTISCVGDSITAGCFDEEGLGWVSRLSQKIAQKFPLKYLIYNFGISDNTSLDCWHTINGSIAHSRTDILIFMLELMMFALNADIN
jgi:lysophospholipase L1-like esterase